MNRVSRKNTIIIIGFIFLTGCADYFYDGGHPVFLKSPKKEPATESIVGTWCIDASSIADIERYSQKKITDSFLVLKNDTSFIAKNMFLSPKGGGVKSKSFLGKWSLELRTYGWTVVLEYFEDQTHVFHPLYIHGQNPYYLIEYIYESDTPPCIVWSKCEDQEEKEVARGEKGVTH